MGSRKKERKKETRTLFRIASWFGHMVFQDGRALQPRTVAAETVLQAGFNDSWGATGRNWHLETETEERVRNPDIPSAPPTWARTA